MHKRKPHKGLSKRVTVTARKNVVHKKAYAGHLMSGKPGARRQKLRRKGILRGGFRVNALRALNEA